MEELRKLFHEDLAVARDQLVRLAAWVAELIPRVTEVLLEGDLEGAERIIEADAELDRRAVEAEEHCIQILALQTPVAGELRQVVALLKMVAEVERSGDLACSICKATRRMNGHQLDPKLKGLITRMSEQAQALYRAAIEAFVENDPVKAAELDDMDAVLDALQKQLLQAVVESHEAGLTDLAVAMQMAVVARFYERIGDHAVNIAERVRFIVTGWLPDHKKSARSSVDPDSVGWAT